MDGRKLSPRRCLPVATAVLLVGSVLPLGCAHGPREALSRLWGPGRPDLKEMLAFGRGKKDKSELSDPLIASAASEDGAETGAKVRGAGFFSAFGRDEPSEELTRDPFLDEALQAERSSDDAQDGEHLVRRDAEETAKNPFAEFRGRSAGDEPARSEPAVADTGDPDDSRTDRFDSELERLRKQIETQKEKSERRLASADDEPWRNVDRSTSRFVEKADQSADQSAGTTDRDAPSQRSDRSDEFLARDERPGFDGDLRPRNVASSSLESKTGRLRTHSFASRRERTVTTSDRSMIVDSDHVPSRLSFDGFASGWVAIADAQPAEAVPTENNNASDRAGSSRDLLQSLAGPAGPWRAFRDSSEDAIKPPAPRVMANRSADLNVWQGTATQALHETAASAGNDARGATVPASLLSDQQSPEIAPPPPVQPREWSAVPASNEKAGDAGQATDAAGAPLKDQRSAAEASPAAAPMRWSVLLGLLSATAVVAGFIGFALRRRAS